MLGYITPLNVLINVTLKVVVFYQTKQPLLHNNMILGVAEKHVPLLVN
jgi:hypothetical protein